ncbi:hypothetical protein [Undibacterium baiyunense]|uniref:Uncharacterized protein n=1 Tax=Undibacterium baiyunense TaxID=2828731 RepID=A0A941DF64_9BURK|nr:hypothetical protein [Undibacterium baiyunense]MBR7745152.1 hypothetical protein [Undibacterium baiyunense]
MKNHVLIEKIVNFIQSLQQNSIKLQSDGSKKIGGKNSLLWDGIHQPQYDMSFQIYEPIENFSHARNLVEVIPSISGYQPNGCQQTR